jgi:hypothetical protein
MRELQARMEQETGVDAVAQPKGFLNLAEQKIWWEMAKVEREALIAMRREQRIGDEAMHEIEREIDLLESRITPQGG